MRPFLHEYGASRFDQFEDPQSTDDAVVVQVAAAAAALANSGLAAWLPLSCRAQLVPGEQVLII